MDIINDADYNALRNSIVKVLKRYFECDDMGEPNSTFDDSYTAQEAIDDIHEIIGDI